MTEAVGRIKFDQGHIWPACRILDNPDVDHRMILVSSKLLSKGSAYDFSLGPRSSFTLLITFFLDETSWSCLWLRLSREQVCFAVGFKKLTSLEEKS